MDVHPVLLQFGSLKLPTYTVMVAIATIASILIVRSEARRLGWDVRAMTWLALQCAGLGFVGAHVLYGFTRLDLPWDQWWRLLIFRFGYGNVWFGGFFLGWAWCAYAAKKRGLNPWKVFDVFALASTAALAIGRLGCFFNGCCYGLPTTLPWGVINPHTWEGHLGLRLHPTPLYEMAYQAVLGALLWKNRKNTRYDGQTLMHYLIATAIGRFVIEFWRGDAIRGFVIGWLSTSQFISLGIIVAVLVVRRILVR